ncbi:MAG: wax ester/triacylglycerol synthase domain-containing protein [Acidimicrobiales bacterium]|jgi:WS/DGAT/MGAT family acyltransferase
MAPHDDQFMRDADALAWNMEHDPGLRSTIVAVAWLDASPDFAVLAARLERATRLAPRFRQRPVCPPARLSTPQWVHCEFDLSLHLRRIEAPAPYTAATVIDFARCEAMTGFDASRPLWAFTLVEGLEGGRAALVMKVHHSLTDGVGGMRLAMLVFETTAVPERVEEVSVPEVTPVPQGLGLARGALGHDAARTLRSIRAGVSLVVPSARIVASHPLRAAFDVVATASSLARFVRPMSDTLSPIMTRRSLDRHLDLLEVDLADLRRAAAVVGCTLNDAFVAAVTGGLRRYHELHGAPVRELRVTMPISLRKADDPDVGNRITLERFAVPVAEADPGTRVRMTGWKCRAARYEEALSLSDAVAALLNLLPAGVIGSMLKHVDFVASDIPGVGVPIFLAGAPVTGYFAFGPTTGAALNVTLVSYRGVCCVSCTIDTAAVPDPEKLMGCLHDGFDEVLGLGGSHRAVTSPLTGRGD